MRRHVIELSAAAQSLAKGVAIAEIAVHLFDGQPGQVLQIRTFAGERPDFHPGLDQRACDGPADKSCRSGDERLHA